MFSALLKPHQIGCSNTKENQGMNPFYFQKHKNLRQEESFVARIKSGARIIQQPPHADH
jgi:hypothetical protein